MTSLLVLAAISLTDAATLVLFAGMFALAVPFIRSRRKDGVIGEQRLVIEGKNLLLETETERRTVAESRLEHAVERRQEAEKKAAAIEARYQEQAKYTAENALGEVKDVIFETGKETQRALGRIESLLSAVMVANELRDVPGES